MDTTSVATADQEFRLVQVVAADSCQSVIELWKTLLKPQNIRARTGKEAVTRYSLWMTKLSMNQSVCMRRECVRLQSYQAAVARGLVFCQM
jgi:hypothetical protein